MEIIDRYIQAVKHNLPAEQQDEISKELKANILDEVDARIEQGQSQEKASQDVLGRYGHPIQTAHSYHPQAPLVDGIDMPLYKKMLGHTGALLFVIALVQTITSMLQADSINPFRLIFQTLNTFLEHVSLGFLLLTVAFYYLGKANILTKWRFSNWSLSKLPKGPQLKVTTSDTVTDLISNSFLLMLLWTSLWMSEQSYQQQVLALAPNAEHWRWILTVLCIQSLIQSLYRLTLSYWNRPAFIAHMVDEFVFAIAFFWMATEQTLFVVQNSDYPEALHTFILQATDVGISYTLIGAGVVLLIVNYFQLRKLPLFKD